MEVKFIAFGAGQCSSVLPFLDGLDRLEYDLVIFCDIGYELLLTYEWVKIVQKLLGKKFIWLKTSIKESHPPFCTKDGKVLPARRYLRSIGVTKAIKYLGYTIEEGKRAKPNSVKWIENKFPLIERRMTRKNCQEFLLHRFGFIPPRSGCTICKYFNRQILEVKKND